MNMDLELFRFSSGKESSLGLLHDITAPKDQFLCFTLEDEPRKVKVDGETCIPSGLYEIKLRTVGGFHERYSAPTHWAHDIHKGMLWLQDVPGFEYILIHAGNTDEDTRGCILVGDGVFQNVSTQGHLQSSRDAYRRIYPPIAAVLVDGGKVTIRID